MGGDPDPQQGAHLQEESEYDNLRDLLVTLLGATLIEITATAGSDPTVEGTISLYFDNGEILVFHDSFVIQNWLFGRADPDDDLDTVDDDDWAS